MGGVRKVKCAVCAADLSAKKTRVNDITDRLGLRAPGRVVVSVQCSGIAEDGEPLSRRPSIQFWLCAECAGISSGATQEQVRAIVAGHLAGGVS